MEIYPLLFYLYINCAFVTITSGTDCRMDVAPRKRIACLAR